jgi:hypothetical protein
MNRRIIYPLESRNGLLFLENYSVVGFNLPPIANMDGLLGINFMRNCAAIINTQKATITFST